MSIDKKKNRFSLPVLLAFSMIFSYYMAKQIVNPIPFQFLIILPTLDILFSFFFGFFILGLLGIVFSLVMLPIHKFFRRNKNLKKKYVMLKTGYSVTGSIMLKRAFLLFAMSITLTLTTIQFGEFLNLFPKPPGSGSTQTEINNYINNFNFFYTLLTFFYSFIISIILVPTWYFDDINLMFYRIEEDVTFLYPFGRSVLPWLKGFGGPSIIISYLIFIMGRVGTDVSDLMLLLDPIVTLFIPIFFMIGFETVSFLGKRVLKKYVMKQGIESYDELRLELIRKNNDEK
ncbi:MAG: hypothetical protein ACTSVI_10735 [Promethearchaeota archaeon]